MCHIKPASGDFPLEVSSSLQAQQFYPVSHNQSSITLTSAYPFPKTRPQTKMPNHLAVPPWWPPCPGQVTSSDSSASSAIDLEKASIHHQLDDNDVKRLNSWVTSTGGFEVVQRGSKNQPLILTPKGLSVKDADRMCAPMLVKSGILDSDLDVEESRRLRKKHKKRGMDPCGGVIIMVLCSLLTILFVFSMLQARDLDNSEAWAKYMTDLNAANVEHIRNMSVIHDDDRKTIDTLKHQIQQNDETIAYQDGLLEGKGKGKSSNAVPENGLVSQPGDPN